MEKSRHKMFRDQWVHTSRALHEEMTIPAVMGLEVVDSREVVDSNLRMMVGSVTTGSK